MAVRNASRPARGKAGRPGFGDIGLKSLRILVAVAVLLAFTLVLTDFRHGIGDWFAEGLARTQLVPSWQSVLSGVMWPGLALFVGLLLATLLFGRAYCSFLCPFGILQDVAARIGRWLKPAKKRAYKYARPVKWVRPGMVALIVLATVSGLGGLAWTWLDPYSQFGRFAAMLVRPLAASGNNLLAAGVEDPPAWLYSVPVQWPLVGWALVPMLALLLAAAVMALLRGRLYCNTICPVGAILGLLSRYSLFRVMIDRNACVKCAKCMKSCKAQCIDLKKLSIDHSRCVNCFNCTSVCDNMGIRYRLAWRRGAASPPGPTPHGGRTGRQKRAATAGQPDTALVDMMPVTDRRGFLTATVAGVLTTVASCAENKSAGAIKATSRPGTIAPPGSRSIREFVSACTGCQLCVAACPGNCLKPAYMEYGLTGIFKPRMTYEAGFCQFDCTTCSEVCPTGAIKALDLQTKHQTVVGKAALDLTHCIPANDKYDCGACAEHCPVAALEMVRFTQPVLSPGDCVSCLKCAEVCPSGAITYTSGPRKKPVFDYGKCIGCGRCVPICEGSALAMRPSSWDIRVPVLHEQYCIGCGGCESICPPRTITVKGISVHEIARQVEQEKVVNPNEGVDFPF